MDRYSVVGKSALMRAVSRTVSIYARTDATVLITGESGTGKELVARALHRESERSGRPFVPVNCAAIPAELLESELFGHRRGAFSGAIADRQGRFELADGGTLFLDEIGDMSVEMQAKLLRALQERTIDPVGAQRQVAVDVRVVAATHRDLEAACAEGRFREDLYYRINVLPLQLPPLRERAQDIPVLVEHFARTYALQGTQPVSLAPDLMLALSSYAWPGNIRELSNLMQRLSVMFPSEQVGIADVPPSLLPRKLALTAGPGRSEAEDQQTKASITEPAATEGAPPGTSDEALPEDDDPDSVEQMIRIACGRAHFPPSGVFLKERLAEFERNVIGHALSYTDGNISRTAQLLGLQRTTLIQKLNRMGRPDRNGEALEGQDDPSLGFNSAAANE